MSKRKLNNRNYLNIYLPNEPWDLKIPKRSSHLKGKALNNVERDLIKNSIPEHIKQQRRLISRYNNSLFRWLKHQIYQYGYNGSMNDKNYQDLYDNYIRGTTPFIKKTIKNGNNSKEAFKKIFLNDFKRFISRRKINNNNNNEVTNEIPISGGRKKTKSKRKIHKGPRGGKYYINNGKKVYIRK